VSAPAAGPAVRRPGPDRSTAATRALPPLARYALGLGDDALVLAQRCAQWVTRAPELEEDVALANIGLDLLGRARLLLALAGEVEGAGRDEDDLAYLRGERDLLNVQLAEIPNGDFAVSTARLLVAATAAHALYDALRGSTDERLAAVAGKAVKEAAYHLDHARSWVVRLGDGTEESHRRVQAGLDEVWPYASELFERDPLVDRLVERGVAADPDLLRPVWEATVSDVLAEATLEVPETTWRPTGGRRGQHTGAFGHLLAELQHLHRSHPGASW
jgi:ring-1,2-phenylacetyl-CoA epoxidase subunit PaaC